MVSNTNIIICTDGMGPPAQSCINTRKPVPCRRTVRVLRAIPKWVVRRSRPLIARVSARIAVHNRRLPNLQVGVDPWAPGGPPGKGTGWQNMAA